MTRILPLLALSATLFDSLMGSSAQAQSAIRTYVSITGNDNNLCSLAAPCRHFQAAVNATALGGEVDALDPGGYGAVTINQAITIEGQGWSYVAPGGTNGVAIAINASSGTVTIHGLSLNGVGATGSTDGITLTGGGTLDVEDTTIRNFTNAGIILQPTAPSQVFVSDTLLADNQGTGFIVSGEYVTGSLDHVRVENNSYGGIYVQATSAGSLSISNSVIANNSPNTESTCGISALTSVTAVNISDSVIENNYNGICVQNGSAMTVQNSTIAGSTNDGITVSGTAWVIQSIISGNNLGIYTSTSGTTWVTRSTINDNGTGIYTSGGPIYTYGDNNLYPTESNFTSPALAYQ